MAQKVKKRQLGLGIKALLQDYEVAPRAERGELAAKMAGESFRIPVADIEPNPFQPRDTFDAEALGELAQSIRTLDVIQPLTVRSLGNDRFQLISGERRLRASKLAGLVDVPAYVRTADDQGMLEMAIVENVQRADLNPIETAVGYQRLLDEVGITHEALSDRLGKQRSTITNALRLLKLTPEAQQSLKAKRISAGHGRALVALEDVALQLAVLNQIEREGWSVRQTEAAIRRMTQPEGGRFELERATPSPELKTVQRELANNYGTKVAVKRHASGKGQFVIHYSNEHDFDRILGKLRGGE